MLISEKVKKAFGLKMYEALKEGVAPWKFYGLAGYAPQNYTNVLEKNNRVYQGSNVFFLSLWQAMSDYKSPFWVTYKQAQKLGGNVKKGATGAPILAPIVKKKENDEEYVSGWRYATVFNIEQCENLPGPPENKGNVEIPDAEKMVGAFASRMKGGLRHSSGTAYFTPAKDMVTCPSLNQVVSTEEYYSTLFHEFSHRTMSTHDMDISKDLPRESEEVIAEISSSFLCNHAGIGSAVIDNQISYVVSYMRTVGPEKLFALMRTAHEVASRTLELCETK